MTHSAAATIARGIDAYYIPTDRFAGDVPEVGITDACDPESCPDNLGTCDVCELGMCSAHPAPERGLNTTPTLGCDGWMHTTCHNQACNDKSCWFED